MERRDTSGRIVVDAVDVLFEGRHSTLQVEALRDVSLTIEPGEFVAVVGASGSGKSTLLNVLAGLLSPTQGTVEIDGSPVRGPRFSVGMMFQTPELFPWRTALGNVLLPIDAQGLPRAPHLERARELLSTVGLSGFERAYPRELSGGMQQRVALSRTLMADPTILLMDEPFGALDEFTRERLDFELQSIWQRERKTVVFVTHNIGEAVLLSDRVVVMGARPGRVLQVVPIDLPRPRALETMRDDRYLDATFRVRDLIGSAP